MPNGGAPTFAVRILTPMGEVLATEAVYVRAPAREGLLGVMAGHAPMVARLEIGDVVVTEPSGARRHVATVEGVLQVEDDEVLMLAEAAEEAEEIDVERARRALRRAHERLERPDSEDIDLMRAELALSRARNRLRVVEQAGM